MQTNEVTIMLPDYDFFLLSVLNSFCNLGKTWNQFASSFNLLLIYCTKQYNSMGQGWGHYWFTFLHIFTVGEKSLVELLKFLVQFWPQAWQSICNTHMPVVLTA